MHGAGNSAVAKSLRNTLLWSGLTLLMLSAAAGSLSGGGSIFVAASMSAFAVAGASLALFARRHLHAPRFGAANVVTVIRLALTAMLAALLLVPVSDTALWLCIFTATAALLLDGLDGRLARRFSEQSRFGARFDMEVDALLILVLALLAWHFGRAGAWVLTAGLLRYAFVGAATFFPWLRGQLPDSLRRKTVCIVQSTTLLVCMGPIVPAGIAPWVAGGGVVLLIWSFALDTTWLYNRREASVLR
jgi:phosphatidylglycerophosphate synthase